MGSGRLNLSCALGSYDLNRGLISGSVSIQGVDLVPLVMSSPVRHWRTFRQDEFDIAEVSFGAFLSINERRPGDYVAIPAFPHRRFRHSYLYTAADSAERPVESLAGGRIGIRTWTNTAGVWTRGILADRHGLDLSSVTWVTQDADTAGVEPPGFRLESVEPGQSVVDLACRGELDALIYPEIPDVLGRPGGLRRFFTDAVEQERRYFRETGLFPIMHTVVLRGELVDEHPWLPLEVLQGFRASKDHAMAELVNPRNFALAWVRETYERQLDLMGSDPWAYDIAGSAVAVEVFARYAREQGIVTKEPTVADLFHPSCVTPPPSYVRR